MLNHPRKRKPSPTELTWEEKNPIDYLYCSSEAIKRLREIVERKAQLLYRTEKKASSY